MGGAYVTIGGSNKQLKDVLKDTDSAIALSAQEWNKALGNADEGTKTLFDSMKGLRGEARQHQRLFSFYGSQLSGLMGQSKETATAIAGVGIALGSGMFVTAGIEAVKLVVDHFREAKKEAEAFQKQLDDIQAKFDKITASRNLKAIGGTEAMAAREEVSRAPYEERLKLEAKLNELEAQRAEALEMVKSAGTDEAATVLRGLDSEIERTRELIAQKDKLILKAGQAFIGLPSAMEVSDARSGPGRAAQDKAYAQAKARIQQQNEEAEKARDQFNTFMLQKAAELATGEAKIDAEWEVEKQQLYMRSASMTQTQYDAEWNKLKEMHDRKAENFRIEQQWRQGEIQEQALLLQAQEMGEVALAKQRAADEDAKRKFEAVKKQTQELAQAGANLASIFADVGTAIGGTAGSMFATFGKLIQQAIQLGIAMSATGGPYAWLNVAAAAAAIIATVSSVPSYRADGGNVAAGVPYIVGERGPELMVPSQNGNIVPNHQLGAGGSTINLHFNAPVDRAWWLQNQRNIMDAIAAADRNRIKGV